MFLLIDGSGTFDKAIEEDSLSHTIAQAKFNISHVNLSASINWAIFWK